MNQRISVLIALASILTIDPALAVKCEMNGVIYNSQWHPDCRPISEADEPALEEQRRQRLDQLRNKGSEERKPDKRSAGQALTVGGNVACQSRSALDDVIKFVAAQDFASFNAYVNSNRCFILKDGLVVTVTTWPGVFGGKAEFAFRGQKFWTVRGGLDY